MADYDLQLKLEQAKLRFTQKDSPSSPITFQERLRGHDDLLNRNYPVKLQPELEADREGIDYQTYELEKALFDNIAVLKMNATLFDVLSLSNRKKDKETSRKILLWLTRGWEVEDEGRQWDETTAEGQTKHGFEIQRQMWRAQFEPTTDNDDDESALEERTEKLRRRRHPFYWTQPSPYGCYWLGDEASDEGADIFFYEYELPYMEACTNFKRKTEDDKYEYPDPTKRGGEFWHDRPREVDANSDDACMVVVVDYRDGTRDCEVEGCEHPQRVIKTFVIEKSGSLDEDCCVEEVDSPFPYCSFMVVGGQMQKTETDINLRYRPVLGPMYGEAQMTNYLTTLLLTMTRKDYGLNRLYLNAASASPEILNTYNTAIGEDDAQSGYIKMLPDQENLIQWFPGEVQRIPSAISPHLKEELDLHRQLMGEYKPNRFAIGNAYDEARSATSTAYTAAQQQSRLPFSQLLSKSDTAILRSRRGVIHAVKFWALADPEGVETRYYYITSGRTDVAKIRGSAPEPGETGYITAADLQAMDFEIIIMTDGRTQQEEGADWLQASDKYMKGVIDTDLFIREAGSLDVQGMKERLELDNNRQLINPTKMMLKKQIMERALFALTGYDPTMAAQQAQNPQQGGQQSMPPSGPPPVQGSSQSNAGSAVPPNSIMNRTIPPPNIPSPSGGSSPFA